MEAARGCSSLSTRRRPDSSSTPKTWRRRTGSCRREVSSSSTRSASTSTTEAGGPRGGGSHVDGIDGGWFPAVPARRTPFFGSSDNCRYCNYDAVCPWTATLSTTSSSTRRSRGIPHARIRRRGHGSDRRPRSSTRPHVAGSPPTVSMSCCSSKRAPGPARRSSSSTVWVALVLEAKGFRSARSRRSRSPRPPRASCTPASARPSNGFIHEATMPAERRHRSRGEAGQARQLPRSARSTASPSAILAEHPVEAELPPSTSRCSTRSRACSPSGGAGRRTSTGCSPTFGSTRSSAWPAGSASGVDDREVRVAPRSRGRSSRTTGTASTMQRERAVELPAVDRELRQGPPSPRSRPSSSSAARSPRTLLAAIQLDQVAGPEPTWRSRSRRMHGPSPARSDSAGARQTRLRQQGTGQGPGVARTRRQRHKSSRQAVEVAVGELRDTFDERRVARAGG